MNRRAFLAAMAAAPAAAQTGEGFTSLFDGQSLNGWSVADGPPTAFAVEDGAIVARPGPGYPAWLRSAREYENFDFQGEFFIKGWMDSGIYIHAPEFGNCIWTGMDFHLFHNNQEKPDISSMGALLPVVPPLKINVKNKGEWNTFRILMDWPRFQAWTNGELVQDVNCEAVPELRHRLRSGYLGLQSLSYPIRFRNLRIRELPGKEKWETLYGSPADMSKWYVSEGEPNFQTLGPVLRTDGHGHIATREKYRDFELQLYVRHALHHNGGVLFRSEGKGLKSAYHYEIQLHDVEGAHYPTGSLYYFKRAAYPRIRAEEWWPMQLIVKDRWCLVRINGETVLEYDRLENLNAGSIELQAHQKGAWEEFRRVRIKRL
ncbi:MAG: DUF1080 domain-containing protein [Bryobacteraceae bacterium]